MERKNADFEEGKFHVLSLAAVTHVRIGNDDWCQRGCSDFGREIAKTSRVQVRLASARAIGLGKWRFSLEEI